VAHCYGPSQHRYAGRAALHDAVAALHRVRFSDAPSFAQIDGTAYLPYFVNKLIDAKLGGFRRSCRR